MVYVVAETSGGTLKDSTYELLVLGKELANAKGTTLKLVALTNDVSTLGNLGLVDEVIAIEDPMLENFVPDLWCGVLCKLVEQKSPQLLLVSNSSYGTDIASNVAGSSGGQHLGYCQNVEVVDGSVNTVSLMFGGKLNVKSSVAAQFAVLSILPGIRNADDGKQDGSPTITKETLSSFNVTSKITFKTLHEPDSTDVDIASQDILISIGRGIQDESNIEMAEELAEAIGGVVSASRPIIDSGWIAKTRQVGKSGKTVKPKLYLALGISGAPEHVEGMRGAELIIAVNTDENAPIFDIAHYGVTTDLFDFVPELIDALDG